MREQQRTLAVLRQRDQVLARHRPPHLVVLALHAAVGDAGGLEQRLPPVADVLDRELLPVEPVDRAADRARTAQHAQLELGAGEALELAQRQRLRRLGVARREAQHAPPVLRRALAVAGLGEALRQRAVLLQQLGEQLVLLALELLQLGLVALEVALEHGGLVVLAPQAADLHEAGRLPRPRVAFVVVHPDLAAQRDGLAILLLGDQRVGQRVQTGHRLLRQLLLAGEQRGLVLLGQTRRGGCHDGCQRAEHVQRRGEEADGEGRIGDTLRDDGGACEAPGCSRSCCVG